MKTAAEYLDIAKAATSAKSDSNLAMKIGVTRSSLHEWRHGKSLPSDETMLRLAKRANLNQDEALILLNFWRSNGEVKKRYERLAKALSKATLTVAITGIIALKAPFYGHLEASKDNSTVSRKASTVYYEKLLLYVFY